MMTRPNVVVSLSQSDSFCGRAGGCHGSDHCTRAVSAVSPLASEVCAVDLGAVRISENEAFGS
jgi:hypothetical protein